MIMSIDYIIRSVSIWVSRNEHVYMSMSILICLYEYVDINLSTYLSSQYEYVDMGSSIFELEISMSLRVCRYEYVYMSSRYE